MAHSTGNITWNTDPMAPDPWPLEGRAKPHRYAFLSQDAHYIGDHGYVLYPNAKAVQRCLHIARGCCLPSREAAIAALEEANAAL